MNTMENMDTTVDPMADGTDEANGMADDPVTYEKGSWQEHLAQSATLLDRSAKARKRASSLLWQGAQEGIANWLPDSDTDRSGESLYNEVLDILGKPRKGDASKIRTVALAVKEHGLVLSVHPNLSKAYAEAVRLTQTVRAHAAEDDAADEAIALIEVPKSTTTVEGAAAILLSKGVDGAVVAILDALGAKNEQAHKAFLRAVSTEIAARVQANKPKPAPKAPAKAKGKAQVATTGTSPKAAVKTAGTKAKAKPTKKAAPVKKATPVPVAAASKGEPVSAPVHAGGESVAVPNVPVSAKPKAKPVVIKR